MTSRHPWPSGLPHAARVLGADPPSQTPTSLVHETAGPELVHYGTRMPGASNARAKAALGWIPAWPSWRRGFERELGESAAQAAPGRPSLEAASWEERESCNRWTRR
jgi:hypothetical protein